MSAASYRRGSRVLSRQIDEQIANANRVADRRERETRDAPAPPVVAHVPCWSRRVTQHGDLWSFLIASRMGAHADDPGEPPSACDAFYGDDPHPLLVAPGNRRRSVLVSGEIRNGKGHHPAATFLDCAAQRQNP